MPTWTRLVPIATFLLMATAVIAQISPSTAAGQTRTSEADRAGIEQVQQTLRQRGHDPGPVDGFMGPQTIAAVKAFQKQHGLTASGQLDTPTLAKLGMTSTTSGGAPQPGSDTTQRPSPSQTQTGGDTKPSPADPAQSNKTGGNVGEGASYSRSSEKPAPGPRPK
jgi:peptidoglycan hydrolase-like protein with peptidoglycan-binding domain